MTRTLSLTAVTKSYGEGRIGIDAIRDVSFTASPGELVAIMGPSGSGKSTLLAIAGGLTRPDGGSVQFGGRDLAEMNASDLAKLRRKAIGYVFQQLNLVDGLTALENVSLPLELDGTRRREANREAAAALDRVSMANLADRFPGQLSGGEQQRVAVARAMVGKRHLLLADEPTGSLDSTTGDSILRLLRRHCDLGGTAVLVTHDARLAGWSDRIVFLADGRVVDETFSRSDPQSLLGDPARS